MVANDTEEITAGKDGIISISSPRHVPGMVLLHFFSSKRFVIINLMF